MGKVVDDFMSTNIASRFILVLGFRMEQVSTELHTHITGFYMLLVSGGPQGRNVGAFVPSN